MSRVDPLESLGIPRAEVPADEARAHLDAFLGTFVLASHRDRGRTLIEQGKWLEAAKQIEKGLDPRTCEHVDEQSRPESRRAGFTGRGVYLADTTAGLSMTLEQASKLSLARCQDAVFSLEAGRRAVFLNHDWGVWYCRARTH